MEKFPLAISGEVCHTEDGKKVFVLAGKGERQLKKKIRKAGVFVLLALALTLLPAIAAEAGFRRQTNGKYRYYTTKTAYIKGRFKNIRKGKKVYTYYFDQNGYMVTGWKKLKVSGTTSWYYFDRNGRMFKSRTKNGHYLQANGRMLVNDWHGSVYYGADGSAVPGYRKDIKNGFKKSKKGIRYRMPNGEYAAKRWLCIKDSQGKYYWYYFYSTGYMAKKTWVGSRWVDKNGRWVPSKKKK